MTNRELLKTPKELLGAGDRQRQFALRVALCPVPCPACRAPVDALAASGTDIDDYDLGPAARPDRCPHCGAELDQAVPFIAVGPGWFWQLRRDWLAERLHKARLYDQMTAQTEGDPKEPHNTVGPSAAGQRRRKR